jgi:hypothetical protein
VWPGGEVVVVPPQPRTGLEAAGGQSQTRRRQAAPPQPRAVSGQWVGPEAASCQSQTRGRWAAATRLNWRRALASHVTAMQLDHARNGSHFSVALIN